MGRAVGRAAEAASERDANDARRAAGSDAAGVQHGSGALPACRGGQRLVGLLLVLGGGRFYTFWNWTHLPRWFLPAAEVPARRAPRPSGKGRLNMEVHVPARIWLRDCDSRLARPCCNRGTVEVASVRTLQHQNR